MIISLLQYESGSRKKHLLKQHILADSSGNFYFYIHNGASFDILFSADVERPKLLEEERSGAKDSRSTYADGYLVLWSSNPIKEERTLSSQESRCRGEILPSCALRSSLQEPVP